MPPAARNLFEKRFLDLQKLLVEVLITLIKRFCGVQGRFFQKEPLAAGGNRAACPPEVKLEVMILILALVFISPLCRGLYGEDTGYKYFKNYTYKDYDHQPQNWGIAQAPNGIIYVANQAGVLEFDGVTWRVIGIPDYATVRSLAIDKTGTVYIGAIGEIGNLAPDEKGTLKFKSLRPYLPKSHGKFSDVWKTYATEKGVYFQSPEYLFRWEPQQKKMKVWKPGQRFYFAILCAGKLFIRQENLGLMEMIDDTLQLVPGGEGFIEKKIYMMAPYDGNDTSETNDPSHTSNTTHTTHTSNTSDMSNTSYKTHNPRILIGTDTNGIYLYDGTGIQPFPTAVDEEIKKNKLYHGIRLSTGDFALATLHAGLFIIDPHGRLKCKWDKAAGLQDDCVYYVFEDREENLWLCQGKGITKIENASPLSIHDERSGLAGIGLAVARHKNDLYVGTTNGLYYLETPFKFTRVTGITAGCWDLLSRGEILLAATSEGVIQVEKEKKSQPQTKPVIKDQAFVLCPSQYTPGRVWCGTNERLVVLGRKNGRWQEEHRYEPINQEIRFIAEEKNRDLWLVTAAGSVIKMEFPAEPNPPTITWYETTHGLPGGRVYVAQAADHVMFATEKGLYRYDEEKNAIIPDPTIGAEFAGGPDTRKVFRLVEDRARNIWIHSESRNYQAIPTAAGTYTIYDIPFRRIPLIQVNAIYPDPGGRITWYASFDGLIRYDAAEKKNYTQPFRTLIRKVLANETPVFDGNKKETGNAAKNLYRIFTYKERNLHFEFAAPFFEVETETQYRCYLEGYEKDWSTWSKDTKRNYTNLDPGPYAFRVQAKNIYGHTGSEDMYRFKVQPPWNREWWAYVLYGAGLFLLGFLGVKWRFAKLEQEKQKLEYTVKERTKEIQTKNMQLKDQSEKLEEMDRVKSRFFANLSHEFRTPLTLIMGPIEQMMTDTRDHRQKQELSIMLRNAQRLLMLINQLLDLSRFDSGKVKLQAVRQDIVPFLKTLVSSFEPAAQKNRLELEFHSEEERIILYFDPPKMEEVMYNLLINALRYTPAGGKITVTAALDQPRHRDRAEQPPGGSTGPGFVGISVRDTGEGIPIEQLPYIFDRFYQAKGPRQEALKGTGIGLSLVKENVVLHQGKIDVHSQEGKGTEFVVRLPLGQRHLKPDEIKDADTAPGYKPLKDKEIEALSMITDSEIETEAHKENGEEQSREAEMETGMKGETGTNLTTGEKHWGPGKPVILVVEDHVEVRKYIGNSLKPGYTVIEAGEGKEGIEKAREIIPDLIVSDIMMPGIDGCELCREIKTEIKTSHIPIILLTARASEESIIQGYETGADDYITKPFNAKILLARVKNLIELRRQLQEKIQKQMLLQPGEIVVSSMDQEFIKEIQSVIEKNLKDSKFNVEELSKKLVMNRVTLYRKMMALTGETPTEFIRSYRLKRAAQLLRGKYGTVSQVALAVGFENPAYFAKCFREKFQQLPSSYQVSETK